jgi:hypothetical protein
MTGWPAAGREVLLLTLVALFLGLDGPSAVRPVIVEQTRMLGTPDLQIRPETGHAFVVRLASLRPAPLPEPMDDSGRVNLELLEGARPLHLQTVRSSVRRNAGAYVWVDNTLYFSTTDGTDPRTAGRPYRIVYRAALPAPPKSILSRLLFPAAVALLVLSWAIAGPMGGRGLAGGLRGPGVTAVSAVLVAGSLLYRHWNAMPQPLFPWILLFVWYWGLSTAVPAPLAAALVLAMARLAEKPYLANWSMGLLACLGAISLLVALRPSSAPRQASFAHALSPLWLLPAAWLASATTSSPALSLASLAAGATFTLLIRRASRREPSPSAVAAPSPYWLWAGCALVFLVALGASVVALRSLSTPFAPDTAGYWSTWAGFWSRVPGSVPIRTPQYELLFAVFEGAGLPGIALIGFQFTIRALACAAIAWHLGREGVVPATFVGLLLAIDPVSAAASVQYLSESLCTSGLVLAMIVTLALVRNDRSRTVLVAAGLVIGWGALFRPGGAALMAAAVALLGVTTRSLRRTLLPAAGAASVALAIVLRNVLRSGVVTLAATGLYLAFPLFIQQLFRPENGPVSAAMHRRLQECHLGLDYSRVTLENSNAFVYLQASPCLLATTQGSHARLYALYNSAYVEAAMARPWFFIRQMTAEALRFVGTAVTDYPDEWVSYERTVDLTGLCRREAAFSGYPEAFVRFVCPMPPADPRRGEPIVQATHLARVLYEPYLWPYMHGPLTEGWREAEPKELAGAAGIVFMIFAVGFVSPAYRQAVFASTIVIVYHAVTTALGQVTLVRYVAMMSPFFLIITGAAVATVARDLAVAVSGQTQRRQQR